MRIVKSLAIFAALAVPATFLPVAAHADTVYSLVSNFGGANALGDPYSFGYFNGAIATGTFQSFGAIQSNYDGATGVSYFSTNANGLPVAAYNLSNTGTVISYLNVGPDAILIHPGPNGPTGVDGDLIVLFTAPSNGSYSIDSDFTRADAGNGVKVGVYVKGVKVAGDTLPGTLGADYTYDSPNGFYLTAGQTIVFDLNNNGDYGSDSTAFSAVINEGPTPEPSSIVLLGTGVLGLAGVVRRRFKV